MKRLIFTTLIAFSLFPFALALPTWEPAGAPSPATYISLAEHPFKEDGLLAASEREIFEGADGQNWSSLWRAHHGNQRILKLETFDEFPHSVFALTTDGIYEGNLLTPSWEKVYQDFEHRQKGVYSMAVVPGDKDHWVVGTASGLAETDDAGRRWYPLSQLASERFFSLLQFSGGKLFAAADNTLFSSEDLTKFVPVFSLPSRYEEVQVETEEMAISSASEAVTRNGALTAFVSSGEDCRNLWLGTRDGVYQSADCGSSWERLAISGMRSVRIEHLAYASKTGQLFASTADGIYAYHSASERWEEIFQGLTDTHSHGLLVAGPESEFLVALTRDGVMRLALLPDDLTRPSIEILPLEKLEQLRLLIQNEPSAREVQAEAIRYANVSNAKIRRWHWQSRLRNLIPDISFGRSLSRSSNFDIDRGSTSERDFYISGPEDLSQSWDVDVSWDLADMIWNSSQPAIDSRDKLMVELRHDLLAEATRVYYERRRLQVSLITSPALTEQENLEQLIRLDELTSLLDAMTDGMFGKKLQTIYQTHPELGQIFAYQPRIQFDGPKKENAMEHSQQS